MALVPSVTSISGNVVVRATFYANTPWDGHRGERQELDEEGKVEAEMVREHGGQTELPGTKRAKRGLLTRG